MFDEPFEWTQGRILMLQDLKFALDEDNSKTVTVGELRKQYNALLIKYEAKQKRKRPYGDDGRKREESEE